MKLNDSIYILCKLVAAAAKSIDHVHAYFVLLYNNAMIDLFYWTEREWINHCLYVAHLWSTNGPLVHRVRWAGGIQFFLVGRYSIGSNPTQKIVCCTIYKHWCKLYIAFSCWLTKSIDFLPLRRMIFEWDTSKGLTWSFHHDFLPFSLHVFILSKKLQTITKLWRPLNELNNGVVTFSLRDWHI